jgi:hypothetical protein
LNLLKCDLDRLDVVRLRNLTENTDSSSNVAVRTKPPFVSTGKLNCIDRSRHERGKGGKGVKEGKEGKE